VPGFGAHRPDLQRNLVLVRSGPESIQRRKASGVEDPEHAQLLKAAFVFVDAPVFLSRSGPNHPSANRLEVVNAQCLSDRKCIAQSWHDA